MKSEIKSLVKRLDHIEVSKVWNPSHEEIIVGFINELGLHAPELHRQIIEYINHRIHELEGEAKTN